MDYAILDTLTEQSEARREDYEKKNGVVLRTGLEECVEPFAGSSPSLRMYIYKNYITKAGAIDLAIIIHETNKGRTGEFALNNVECSIFPLYMAKEDTFEIPPFEEAPVLPEEVIRFILEKRSLPKKPFGSEVEFDPAKHRWSINRIAEELGMSNRTIGKYVRVKNL